ncbi:MAG: Gfo/Idh/MocA family protein [Promethearchaeota archaeon]
MPRKIGVALVGCGNISLLHTRGYRDFPEADVVALCDLNPKRAKKLREEAGLPASTGIYGSAEECFRDPGVDLVEVLTPHAFHEEPAILAAEAGKHVSVQKPPAMTLSSYDRMVAAARKAGVRFRVYENFRYHPPYQKAFDLVRSGVIGEVESVHVRMWESVKTLGEYRGSKKRFPLSTLRWKIKEEHNYKAPTLFDDGYHKHSVVQGFLGDGKAWKAEPVTAVRAWCGWQRLFKAVKIDSPAVVVYETRRPHKYGTWNVNMAKAIPFHSSYFACDESLEVTGTRGIIISPGCTGDLFAGCACGGPGAPGVYWFSRDDTPGGTGTSGAAFEGAGTWKSDCSMVTDWKYSFVECTRHLASLLARDEWFDDADPRPLGPERGRQVLRINLAMVRSLRTDGAQAKLGDVRDGPGVDPRGGTGGVVSVNLDEDEFDDSLLEGDLDG